MNNSLLTKLGLGNLDIGIVLIALTVVVLVLLILLITTMTKLSRLNRKYKFFMKGKAAESLEEEIMALFEDNTAMKADIAQNKKDIRLIKRQLSTAYQKMSLVKYDAFDQMGGKLSFVLVLLDEHNNGFLLNSQHTTDSCYSYTKRIEFGECKMDLSNEEKVALNKAIVGDSDEAN